MSAQTMAMRTPRNGAGELIGVKRMRMWKRVFEQSPYQRHTAKCDTEGCGKNARLEVYGTAEMAAYGRDAHVATGDHLACLKEACVLDRFAEGAEYLLGERLRAYAHEAHKYETPAHGCAFPTEPCRLPWQFDTA